MPSKQFLHIQQIRNDFQPASEQLKRLKDSLNNSVRTLADDLYNKHTHFIFELIQNAEDNSYHESSPSLSFRLTKIDPTGSEGADGALIIHNNETGFTDRNVDAICAVGETTKEKAQGYIGEKGIGFKSVFRVTENPHIFSNGYHFCLPERDEQTGLGYIVPQWVDTSPEGLDLSQTNIILPLTKAEFGYDKIEEMLLEIEPETILFLSKLQEIRIETDTGTDLAILKNADEFPKIEVLVEGSKQEDSFSTVDEFLVCTKTFHKPTEIHHEKREGIADRGVSIAFPLDENSTGIKKIFAYLPVSDTDFPFLINADFILTSSRERIQQDNLWNHWLIDCVADVVTSGLFPLLKEQKLLTVCFLDTLASSLKNLEGGNLFYPIHSEACEAFRTQEFLPANDGTFVSAQNAKLARGDAIRNLLSHAQLGELFPRDESEIKWLSADITLDRTLTLRRYLMDLGIEEVTPVMFARRLSIPFLSVQPNDWFIEFYRFLLDQTAVAHILRTEPILRLQDRTHVSPFAADGPPNAYLPIGTDTDTSLPIVMLEISQDEEARRFLENLGLREWDIVEDVIRNILPKYKDASSIVPVETHRRDFDRIERANNTDSDKARRRLRNALQETPFILVESLDENGPVYRKPEELYLPTNELRVYFEGYASYQFVSPEYAEGHHDMLKELGVSRSIRVTCESTPGTTYDIHLNNSIYPDSRSDCYRRGLEGFDPDIKIDGLENALMNPSPAKSEIIWNRLAIPYCHCISGKVIWSSRQDFSSFASTYDVVETVSQHFGRLLIDTAWLPGANGTLCKPSELTLDQLPDSFKRDERLANQLGMQSERDDLSSLIRRLANIMERTPEELSAILFPPEPKPILIPSTSPHFPERPVPDPAQRTRRTLADLDEAPDQKYEHQMKSVRASRDWIFPKTYLKQSYTNEADQMVCQICHEEMPFKNRSGEYHFAAVEVLKDCFTKEYEAQFLALCPKCSPQYKEFIKQVPEAMEELKNLLMVSNSGNFSVPLKLGNRQITLRFVERHWRDMKAVLAYYESTDDTDEDSTD